MKIFAMTLFTFTCFTTQAYFAKTCRNSQVRSGEVVSFTFENCVNNNFWQISIQLPNTFLNNCRAFPRTEVNYQYENCINENFRKIERVEPRIFANFCSNFNRNVLEKNFITCINKNFETIERDLRFFY